MSRKIKKGDRVKVVTIRKADMEGFEHYIGKMGTVDYVCSDGMEPLYTIEFMDTSEQPFFYMDELRLMNKKHNFD